MRFLCYIKLAIILLLLLVQSTNVTILSWQMSLNRTEAGHAGASIYLFKTFRFDVFHVNPPLTRYIVGLPILISSPEYDWKSYSLRPQDRSEWGIGNAFINANTPEKIHWIAFLTRCSLIPIILLGSWFGYRFACERESGYFFPVKTGVSPEISYADFLGRVY